MISVVHMAAAVMFDNQCGRFFKRCAILTAFLSRYSLRQQRAVRTGIICARQIDRNAQSHYQGGSTNETIFSDNWFRHYFTHFYFFDKRNHPYRCAIWPKQLTYPSATCARRSTKHCLLRARRIETSRPDRERARGALQTPTCSPRGHSARSCMEAQRAGSRRRLAGDEVLE